jgi:hypothetical protein
MTKVSPRADYPVKVVPESWEQEPATARFYEGIYTVVLNSTVDIAFVPDVSALAPPWRELPDDVGSVEQARVASVLLARYAVTPNDRLAGREERFELPASGGYDATGGVVYYVTAAEFARWSAELDRLAAQDRNSFHATRTVSALRDLDIVGFVERRVLTSPQFAERDGRMLGRAGEAGR